ncbi:MAG: hypothetical protein H6752_07130 [Candidatus Omnitrophica bacterium]|nr:hypothetical protein [Candidatus Omnitrophota bacterium]
MKWKKLGNLYAPEPLHPKLVSHAANPLPIHLEGDLFRVFYSGRDDKKRSSVGYVDVDIAKGKTVYVHQEPVFEHGADGSFYSHGVSIGNCYEADGNRYILFMGWQCPPGEHWRGEVGRLILTSEGSLELEGDRPFMPLDKTDPISLSYPWVEGEGNNNYRMWYGSTVNWDAGNGEMVHVIKAATSEDGHQWSRLGVSVPYEVGVAQAFSRPTVVREPSGECRMWFSYRSGTGTTYRIGHAFSPDGEDWELRLQETGIDVSDSGWDSEMIEYPFVLRHQGHLYMLYNGNGYGQSGFGLAILDER